MAVSQQYSLRWNNYIHHISCALHNLRSEDDLVDVTLCCDGKKIRAHKVLLSACSGYFKGIFKENPCRHPVIIFKFIKYDDLSAIIEFMYKGEVSVQQDALQSFLQTAELLAVQGLAVEEKSKENQKFPIGEKYIEGKAIKAIPISLSSCNDSKVELANENNLKENKLSFTNEVFEAVDFGKEEAPPKTSLHILPSKIKNDISSYVELEATSNHMISVGEVNPSQPSHDNTTQTTTQYTSDYEILAEPSSYESEIDEKYQQTEESENMEVTTIEIGRIFSSQESNINGKGINTQDLPSGKWTECQFCKMVITTVNLWRHIRTQHTPQPPRKCDICQKNFKNKYSLREHIRISHEQKHPKST